MSPDVALWAIALLAAVVPTVTITASQTTLSYQRRGNSGAGDPSRFRYSIDGPGFHLDSGANFVTSAGRRMALEDPTSEETLTGMDNLGAFTENVFNFSTSTSGNETSTVQLSFKRYPNRSNVLLLTQRFPQGIPQANTSSLMGEVSSSFPSLKFADGYPSGDTTGFVHFSGYMAGHYPQYGTWTTDGAASFAGGLTEAGVISLFNTSSNSALVISPLTEFLAGSLAPSWPEGGGTGEVRWGLSSGMVNIPAGFEISWVIIACADCGVNRAIQQWGDLMRHYYSRSMTEAHSRDITLQYLGYATDNGAYYYYNQGNHSNYQDTILDLKGYMENEKIPVQSIELDSWWYYRQNTSETKGVPFSGVTNWTARPSVFPGGRKAVHEGTQWRIQAHNRYWAPDNVYASNPQEPVGPTRYAGKHFEFVWGENAGLPASSDFWNYLFSINDDWGLSLYIQDWFSITQFRMPQLNQNVSFGRQWLKGMNDGARAHQVCVQFCMTYPRHVLQALELPAVTQVRASNDFQPESVGADYDQWRIGESSLWVSVLGIAPSKDSYWSMSTPQFTPHYSTSGMTFESRNRLESLVASMSNGPVSVSDRIGYSNKTLIMHCCNTEGLLLRPDISASSMDKYFRSAAGIPQADGGDTSAGVLHSTYSVLASDTMPFVYVLSVNNQNPRASLSLADIASIGIRRQQGAGAEVALPTFGWIATEYNTSTSSTSVRFVNESTPLPLAPSTEWTFQYWSLAPNYGPLGIRYLLLGETKKWISASRQRFLEIQLNGVHSSAVKVAGVWKEDVELRFLDYATGTIWHHECTVPEGNEVTFTVSAKQGFQCVE